jgi:hypothetical protein
LAPEMISADFFLFLGVMSWFGNELSMRFCLSTMVEAAFRKRSGWSSKVVGMNKYRVTPSSSSRP